MQVRSTEAQNRTLTDGDVNIGVLSGKFPDRTFCKSLCAGITAQRVKDSGENLLFRDRIPICPDDEISLDRNVP